MCTVLLLLAMFYKQLSKGGNCDALQLEGRSGLFLAKFVLRMRSTAICERSVKILTQPLDLTTQISYMVGYFGDRWTYTPCDLDL